MTDPAETITHIPLQRLRFDRGNPRLPSSVDGADEQDVLAWMLEDAGLIELMGAIAEEGFFAAEPLLVTPVGGSEFEVLEGNRRLASVMLLTDPDRAPVRKRAVAAVAAEVKHRSTLDALPCVIFQSADDVLDYLGYRHITGIKQWEPAAKARYLRKLLEKHSDEPRIEAYRALARKIGSRSDYVKRLLGSLALFEKIVSSSIEGVDEEDIPFSVITLALNYRAVVDFLELNPDDVGSVDGVNPDALVELCVWLFRRDAALGRTQLGESRNMKYLAHALSTSAGLALLRAGVTAEEAAQRSMDAGALVGRSLRTARDNLRASQSFIHRAVVTAETLEVLGEVKELADQIEYLLVRRQSRNHDV